MIRVNILVEGQTEETFVRDVLIPAYSSAGIFFTAILAETSPGHKGGIVNYGKTKRQLVRLCQRDQSAYVTTMIDYYGLPTDFPGINDSAISNEVNIQTRMELLESALELDVNQNNFIANYLLHEFEALLFCQPDKFETWLDNAPVSDLERVRAEFPTPEHINNSPQTSPSKRIMAMAPHYKKVLHGPMIAGDIGLENIRQQCPHFNHWLERIEALAVNN
ncbi:DUF4276 family protein [Thalassomonas viridans]|uniref:DUF4276 family protein n=2 Tax=Thalassomonas viridans TaxID=137584 RepID=A0AAF0CA07_9GAMM|nr:DUF4276 family protein [Thalassomonas viridans]